MKKFISLLLVFMLMMIGTSGPAQAEETTGNEVQVSFSTVKLYELEGNVFENPENGDTVQGELSWCSVFGNSPDGSGQPAQNVTLQLITAEDFYKIGPPPDPDTHYTWSFGDILPGFWGQVVSVERESNPVSFTPGFDISREVSPTVFTGTEIQTVTVRITPLDNLLNIKIYVSAQENEFVNPQITSPETKETETEIIRLSDDGRQLAIDIANPVKDQTYVYEVKIQVNLQPGITSANFMPRVEGHWICDEVLGDSCTATNDAGTWTWSAEEVDIWNSNVNTATMVRLMEHSWGERAEVFISFHKIYSYEATEDYIPNNYVLGQRQWGTNLFYNYPDSCEPIESAEIGLETGMDFPNINTENLVDSPPSPYKYQWSYNDISPQTVVGTYVAFIPDDPSPVPFKPGFYASRTLSETGFTDEDTQTLTIHVVPQEIPFPWFGINVRIPGDLSFGTNAQIKGCTGADEFNIQEDKQVLNIWQSEPVPGEDYEYTITIQVNPGEFPVEFEPFVEIMSTPGSSPSESVGECDTFSRDVDIGTWTWDISTAYPISFAKDLSYAVRWEPRYEVFINDVTVLFQTFESYVSWVNNFKNPEDDETITGNMFWLTQILNLPDNTGEPISNVTLELDTQQEFVKVKPQPDEETHYQWSYGDIPLGEVYWASVESPNPVDFSPGFDASRSVDRIIFSEPGTQKLTINVTPREANMGTIIIDVFSADDENVDAVIQSCTGADLVFTGNDGHHLLMVKGGPDINAPYQFTVEIDITPKQSQISYLPKVMIYTYLPNEERVPVTGDSCNYDITENDTWTWSANGNYRWNWDEVTVRAIVFPENSKMAFAEFTVESMSIDFYDKPDSDKMAGNGTIGLNDNTLYDFAVDDVVLNIDGIIISIPAGSFVKKNNSECYQYKSDSGVGPQVDIEFDFENSEWRLKINNIGAGIVNNSDGVDITLSIGNIWGGQVIDMRVGGLTYIAAQ